VLRGIPNIADPNRQTAAVSAQNPPTGRSAVIRCPIIFTILHPPDIVPSAFAISIHTLRKINDEAIRSESVSVHALENEGDRLYRHFIGNLYAEERDAIRPMKYSTIYNQIEHTIDKCRT
jgi:hypothetical protein